MRAVQSAQNPVVQRVRKLVNEAMAYRKLGQCWLEGEHLVQAFGKSSHTAVHIHGNGNGNGNGNAYASAVVVMAEAACARADWAPIANAAADALRVPDSLWQTLSRLPPQQGLGLLVDVPAAPAVLAAVPTVVLDRLQDAGNVGSILRSAAALGVQQVIALPGTAGLWSAKVLRAGMGAQWNLHLLEGQAIDILGSLNLPLIATSSHKGQLLHEAELPQPCAWLLGHEGQGIADELAVRCALHVRIPQPGGEESLNAAAAAAVCLYETMRRQLTR